MTLPTSRTKVKRVPNRGHYDAKTIYDILDNAFICHVGFTTESGVSVIPTIHWREDDQLYIHGSTASRMIKVLPGQEACITVTLADGMVLARSVFHHSMNYRSVVVYGQGKLIESPEEKLKKLEVMVEKLVPGRWQDARLPTEQELKATSVIGFDLTEASAKIRVGPPGDDEEDYQLPVWAGVIPLVTKATKPVSDPKLPANISMPDYIANWAKTKGLAE